MNAGYPALDHDHKRCVADALTRAEEACNARGTRLTPLRRRVLQALAESHSPLGAYEIVERLKKTREPVPAMSVYRALDFLLAEGLAHRIESQNAFLACIHGHETDDIVLFLLCERCKRVAEVTSGALGRPPKPRSLARRPASAPCRCAWDRSWSAAARRSSCSR